MFHITNLPSIIPSNPIEWLPPTSKAPILPTSSSLIFWIAHKILLSSILPKRDDYQIPISLYAPKKNGLWPPLLVSFLSCIPRISTEEIFPATYDLSHLNSTNSLVITNISGQSFQIFNAFNFLGDHLSNILCLDAMRSILIFNERNGFPPEINAGALTGLNGLYFALNLFPLQPLVPLDGNGDFNGDGFGDILLRNSAATKLFIFFGRSRGSYPAQVNSALATTISYIFPNSATFAGDINHDGFDDLMFSFYYPLKTPTCNGTNAFYILYGNSNTTNKTILFNPKLIPTLKGAVVTAQGGGCSRNIGLFYGA
ncbi:MAG: FG-GAP repeat domain-containing protein, partial [Chlamydiia bacterium]